MSIKMTARVWAIEDEELEGARLLTLLSLADFANSDDQAWPSVPTLAKRTRISERQIQRSIQWLEATGYIAIIEKGNGRGKLTTYKLQIKGDISDKKGDTMTPFVEEVTPVDGLKGDIENIKGDIGDENYSYAPREPIQQPTTKWEKEIVADATPPAPVDVPAEEPKPRRSRKSQTPPNTSAAPPQREPTDWQEFIGAFCWLCHGHKEVRTLTKEQRGALLSEAKTIHAEQYTVKDLREWYKRVWGQSWQYKKNKTARPLPSDVRSSMAQLRAETPEGFEAEAEPAVVAVGNSTTANNRNAVHSFFAKARAAQGVNGHG